MGNAVGDHLLCVDIMFGVDPANLTDCVETDLFLGSGKVSNDMDLDGIKDSEDNCPIVANRSSRTPMAMVLGIRMITVMMLISMVAGWLD